MIAALAASTPIASLATPRRARWALVAVHLPMIGYLTSVCWTGLGVLCPAVLPGRMPALLNPM